MWQKIKSFLFENKTAKQTVAKNTVWLSISNFGGRLFKAAIIIYAARMLGAAGYGVFSYAVTLAGFFTLFVDPGINSVLIREGAKGNAGRTAKALCDDAHHESHRSLGDTRDRHGDRSSLLHSAGR